MTPSEMQIQIVRDQNAERLRDADRRRSNHPAAAVVTEPAAAIRLAKESDAVALKRRAELESRPAPSANSLVAAIDGAVLAAISLTGGETLADPFHRTADLVEQLAD